MANVIWYISKYVAPPQRASSGSRGFSIMRELAKLGNTSIVITSDSNQLALVPNFNGKHLIEDVHGVKLIWLRTLKYQTAKSLNRILSWFDFEIRLFFLSKKDLPKPDVVIISSLSLLTIFNGLLIRRKYNCKLIFEVRDIWPLTITEEGGFSESNLFVRLLGVVEKIAYRLSDGIVGTMPNLGEHVTEVLGYSKKTHCIPMGVESEHIDNVAVLPKEYIDNHIPRDKFIVGYAGTIGITNALDSFFLCAEKMQHKDEFHFLVVGSGDLKQFYQDKFKHLNNVSFAPKVAKNLVNSVLTQFDLLYFSVHDSKVWQYGQSLNKVIDYMLSGKPIVASYSGFPSMINESGCGKFVPVGDVESMVNVIIEFYTLTPEKRDQIGARGRRWLIENRNYQRLANNYQDVFDS